MSTTSSRRRQRAQLGATNRQQDAAPRPITAAISVRSSSSKKSHNSRKTIPTVDETVPSNQQAENSSPAEASPQHDHDVDPFLLAQENAEKNRNSRLAGNVTTIKQLNPGQDFGSGVFALSKRRQDVLLRNEQRRRFQVAQKKFLDHVYAKYPSTSHFFQAHDTDGNGRIDLGEWESMLEATYGAENYDPEEAQLLFRQGKRGAEAACATHCSYLHLPTSVQCSLRAKMSWSTTTSNGCSVKSPLKRCGNSCHVPCCTVTLGTVPPLAQCQIKVKRYFDPDREEFSRSK